DESGGGGAAGAVGRPELGVSDLLPDVGDFQAQLLGDDGAHEGAGAGTQVLRADRDAHPAVASDGHGHYALRPAASAPGSHRTSDAPLSRPGGRSRRLAAPLPADLLGRPIELPVLRLVLDLLL